VDVIHDLEEVEAEADMDARAVDEFVEGVIIQLFDEMTEENLILMH
jgi:hypothetical protein